jgi:hypothetical protein
MQPHFLIIRQPGARPHSSYKDMLCCYLMWAKLRVDYKKLAIVIRNITSNRVENNINRIRPILHSALTSKWFHEILQPQPLINIFFLHIDIIINVHTT